MVRGGKAHVESIDAGPQRVRAPAADQNHFAGATGDAVVAAQIDLGAGDAQEVAAVGIHLHDAVVAQHGAAPGRRGVAHEDGVAAHAADDDVVALAQRDGVYVAGRGHRVGGFVLEDRATAQPGTGIDDVADLGVVAQHDVVRRHASANSCSDRVLAPAANDHHVATATNEGVVAAQADLGAFEAGVLRTDRVHLHQAVVAQQGLPAVASDDGIGAHACQNGIVAIDRQYVIVAAGAGQGIRRAIGGDHTRRIEIHLAVVTEDDVVTSACGDVVAIEAGRHRVGRCAAAVGATDEDIAAFTGGNVIVAAGSQIG